MLYASSGVETSLIMRLTPTFFFWLGMTYMSLLLLVGFVYNATKDPSSGPTVLAGFVPVAVPWFGAVGAVTISLEGVFVRNNQWDNSYNYWHIGRPLFGAVLAIVAFFLFLVIALASGSTPRFLDGQTTTAKDYIIFYVVAFLVGYREATFRELIKRATDLILKPGVPASAAPVISFKVGGKKVSDIAFTKVGTTTVDIENSGAAPLARPEVKLDAETGTPKETFAVEKDQLTGQELAAGQSRSLDIAFKAGDPGNLAATLSVSGTNLKPATTIRVHGKRE